KIKVSFLEYLGISWTINLFASRFFKVILSLCDAIFFIFLIRAFLLNLQSNLYFPLCVFPPIGPPLIIPLTFVLFKKKEAKPLSMELGLLFVFSLIFCCNFHS